NQGQCPVTMEALCLLLPVDERGDLRRRDHFRPAPLADTATPHVPSLFLATHFSSQPPPSILVKVSFRSTVHAEQLTMTPLEQLFRLEENSPARTVCSAPAHQL